MKDILKILLTCICFILIIWLIVSPSKEALEELDADWSDKYYELEYKYETLAADHEELQTLVDYIADLLEEGEYKEAKSILCD